MSKMHLRDQQLDSTFYYNQQHQEQQEHLGDQEDLRRRESAPVLLNNNYNRQQHQQQMRSGSYPVAVERFPTRKILIQGYLTKLSAHKYWHAKVLFA